MKNNKFGISIALASVLCACANAQVMDIGTNYYRDYLDFAQNKGAFTPQDTPLEFAQRNGDKFTFDKIPNSGARNNKGNFTSLGRNFVVTANHTLDATAASNFNENRGWFGNTKYEYLTSRTATPTEGLYNSDTAYMRTTKYIVEGQIDPIDVPNLDISGNSRATDEANIDKIQNYLNDIKNSGGARGDNVLAYQAGTGALGLEKPKIDTDGYSDVVSAREFEDQNIVNQALGGSVNEISTHYSANYKTHISSINRPGVYMFMTSDRGFRNRLLPGDSGSGFFVYDTVAQKWVLVGVLSAVADNSNHASIVTMTDFNDYKKDYENDVAGSNVTDAQLVQNKDNILTATSDVTLNSDLDLGHGGIVVKNGDVAIGGSGKIKKLAGFDVANGASLNLNVASDTSIHKIGKGSLIVNSSGNKTLRLGDGIVDIRAVNAFEKIYLTSGRGLLRLSVDDSLKDKIFFGNGGGKLDLSGFDQTFSNVSANSNAAKITNLSAQKATLKINGESGKDTIFHASVDKNIDVKHDGQGRELVFDGGFDIDGSLTLNNANVTLQGHPTAHATADNSILTQAVKDKIVAAGLSEPSYMDLTRPSTLSQPDWDKRKFNAKEGIKINSSELTIGKDADVNSDIEAKNSVINLSGELTHYIDKFDGSNTYDDGLKYRQNVEKGNLLVKDVSFKNRIVMDSDSMLRVGGTKTKLKELVINGKNTAPTRSIAAGSGKLEIENLDVSGANKLTFDPDTIVTKNLNIKDFGNANEPILDFKKVLTLGAGMKFNIDFAAALKGEMTAEKTYTLVSAESIVNKGAIFNTEQKINGLFTTYAIKDGKITMRLSDKKAENPSATPGSEQELRLTGFSERQNKILNMFKNRPEYESALQSGDTETLRQMALKAESDMKEISASSLKVSVKALQNGNELINSRLSQITQLRAKADISQFRLAGLESDFKPTAAIAYEAAEASRQRNNFWANVNGAYFKDKDSGGDLKFYGTYIGYDRSYDEFILGVNAGVSKAKFNSGAMSDDAKIYSFGAYGLFERDAHEIQSNLNLAFVNSKRSLNDSQKASVRSTGILSSNYYKYKISLDSNGEYAQAIKPVLALEFGSNGVKGFKNDRYDQKDINDFNVALGVGVEYVLNSDKNAFAAQFLVKQNIYNSDDKSYVSLNNSNEYVDYKLDNNKPVYKLNLIADTKISENFALSYQLGGMLDNDKSYGVSGGIKLEYKF